MTIEEALRWAKSQLNEGNDAYYLLSHVLDKPRSHFYTWPDEMLTAEQLSRYKAFVERRENGEPVAYIVGQKEFWSLSLYTSTNTLIPRPETEHLVEAVLNIASNDTPMSVCDLGTGTGAIALAIASERSNWKVVGVDKVPHAVELAKRNGQALGLESVEFLQSSWFSSLQGQKFDVIVSNPPYVEDNSPYLKEGDVRFEPLSALIAGEDGLDDIRKIIQSAYLHLNEEGWLFFEHGFDQHDAVASLMKQADFVDIQVYQDLNRIQRVTRGKLVPSSK